MFKKLLNDLHEDYELSKERLEICKTCNFLHNNGNDKLIRCNKCGCLLTIKTLFKSQSCPISKW